MPYIGFREDKATQAAAKLLHLGHGRMNLLKLVKLLYLADRTALVRCGRPITMDLFCSLRHGPIVSNTLNLINEQPDPEEPRYWHKFISERQTNYDVTLKTEPQTDQLSRAEEALLEEVFQQFGDMTHWELRDYAHTLPEWKDPGSSMIPIHLRDILIPEGFTEQEVREIEADLGYSSFIHLAMSDEPDGVMAP